MLTEDDPIMIQFKDIVFHRILFRLQSVANAFTLNNMELNLINPKHVAENFADSLFLQLQGELLAYKDIAEAATVVHKEPKTWWDALKREHFPKWLLDRFPVQYREFTYTVKVDLEALFPEFKYIPQSMGKHVIHARIITESDNAQREFKPETEDSLYKVR